MFLVLRKSSEDPTALESVGVSDGEEAWDFIGNREKGQASVRRCGREDGQANVTCKCGCCSEPRTERQIRRKQPLIWMQLDGHKRQRGVRFTSLFECGACPSSSLGGVGCCSTMRHICNRMHHSGEKTTGVIHVI